MSVIGIVGEYNPFHYGHKYHIETTKKLVGEPAQVVCVISGDFVQRGEAAVYSKFARAEAAVRSGADLVLELPVPWSLSSAEGFARGAVGILGRLGVITHLSFGSECGDTEVLDKIAVALLEPGMTEEIKVVMARDESLSFAAARQTAAEKSLGDAARLLETPNNILAVEYIKALYTQGLDLAPITVKRIGSGHDRTGETGPRSASELRSRLSRGIDISEDIPCGAAEVYARENKQGRGPVTNESLELALISRLRMLPDEAFASLPDSGGGLDKRLASACRLESGLDAIAAAAKSKRYALSRIRRMLMCAALGITAEMQRQTPPYARVLAANCTGCALLRDMGDKASIPIITKPASVNSQNTECRELFRLGSAAHDLYVLGCPAAEERRGGQDYRTSPKILL
ncbi:MAG: nucleotidyltransferase family protein [Oscillospiraceae bacterium]|nr:nucleotidyltransferase family protein [Oscillospiraceae bacterium]